jgi:hypothetical protein
MNDEHVLALIKAIDGTDLDAVGVFAHDAFVVDDVGHDPVGLPACSQIARLARMAAILPNPHSMPAPSGARTMGVWRGVVFIALIWLAVSGHS